MNWSELKTGDALIYDEPCLGVHLVTRDPCFAHSNSPIIWVVMVDLETGELQKLERVGSVWSLFTVIRGGRVVHRAKAT